MGILYKLKQSKNPRRSSDISKYVKSISLNDSNVIPSTPSSVFANDANLILEGGSMRCQFTAGVLDFFMEQGLAFSKVIGTSAGALCGYSYLAGQIGRTCLANTSFCDDWRFMSLKSFVVTGNAVGRDFTFKQIPESLVPVDYEAFRKSPMKLVATCSNLETGEADYHEFADPEADLPYLIATSSMPLISQIVEIDGKKLLDGGTCDSIPLDFSLASHAKKHVVVLTQDASFEKKPNKLMALIRQQYADYPHFVERCEHRHYEYNRTYRKIARMEDSGDIFVLRPQKPVSVGTMEKDQGKLLELYEQGYEQALRNWPKLKAYLEI